MTGLAATSVPRYLAGPSDCADLPGRRIGAGRHPVGRPDHRAGDDRHRRGASPPRRQRSRPHRRTGSSSSATPSRTHSPPASSQPAPPSGIQVDRSHGVGVRPRDQQRAGVRRRVTHRVHRRLPGRHPTGADRACPPSSPTSSSCCRPGRPATAWPTARTCTPGSTWMGRIAVSRAAGDARPGDAPVGRPSCSSSRRRGCRARCAPPTSTDRSPRCGRR